MARGERKGGKRGNGAYACVRAPLKSITTVGSRRCFSQGQAENSDPRRPTTKPTRRSIGGANGGIRPSPLDPIAKIVFEGAPEQRRPAKFRVAFSLRGRLLPAFLPPLHAIQATLNQRFESACSRFVSPRFSKKKTARKDRGDRIWPPRETSSSDYWLCKKKEAADILLFPSRFIFFVDGKDFLLVFHLPSIRSPREITPIISDPSTSSNREEEEGAKSCHKSNY